MHRHFRSLLTVGSAQFAVGLISIAVVPVGATRLGVAGYGLFSVFLIVAGFLALLDSAVSKPLIRALSADMSEHERRQRVQVAGGLYLYFALVVCAVVAFAYPWAQPGIFPVTQDLQETLRILVVLAVCEYLGGIPLVLLQSQNVASLQFKTYSKLNVLLGVNRYATMLIAFLLFEDVIHIALAMVLRRALELPLSLRLAKRHRLVLGIPILALQSVKEFAREVSRAAFSQSLYSALLAIGSVLVNHLGGLDALGVYRLAYDLTNRVWSLASVVGIVTFPIFARQHGGGLKDPSTAARRMGLAWAIYLSLGAVGFAVMEPFLQLLGLDRPGVLAMAVLLLLGMVASAYAYISIDFMGAAGRFAGLGLVHLGTIGILWIVTVHAWPALGSNAVGLAWIACQIAATLFLDHDTLRSMGASLGLQTKYAAYKLTFALLVGVSMISVIERGTSTLLSFAIAALASMVTGYLAVKTVRR